jgi:beta-phosphoglucomutase
MVQGSSAIGVIFDMDGVLVDSSEAHYAAWSRLGEGLGVPHPREVFERTFGMHNRQIIPLWLGAHVAEEEIERLSRLKEAMYREAAPGAVRPIDGVLELIGSLHAEGLSLAVGSSGPRENVELVLELLGVGARFSALSTGDEVRRGKPDPEVFLKAAAKLGLAPRSCAVVEDAPAGVEAALAAGMRAIAVTTTRPAAELRRAHLIVESLRELGVRRVREVIAGAGA